MHSMGDGIVPIITAVAGRPFTETMKSWMSLAHHLAPAAQRALAGVGE